MLLSCQCLRQVTWQGVGQAFLPARPVHNLMSSDLLLRNIYLFLHAAAMRLPLHCQMDANSEAIGREQFQHYLHDRQGRLVDPWVCHLFCQRFAELVVKLFHHHIHLSGRRLHVGIGDPVRPFPGMVKSSMPSSTMRLRLQLPVDPGHDLKGPHPARTLRFLHQLHFQGLCCLDFLKS